ncbi:MAG: hypothetical protein SGJ27_01065 [Candidatus Melainabacteria bacterium]|nr:hypothetical protein [Candidatus Melainabacteria bacterium]
MKYPKLTLTSLAIAAVSGAIYLCAPAISQTAGLVPTGNCSLPAGQYMMTNMRTGQAVYVEIDTTGRLMAQDPKALQFAVSPLNYNGNNNTGGFGLGTTGGTIPGDPNADPNQKGGMWGGLLKQGVQSIMNNRTAPTAAPNGYQQ